MMRTGNSIGTWLWKIPLAGLAYALGAILGGALVTSLGLDMPRFPGEFDPAAQTLLLWPAGMAFALGLAAMAIGLGGRWWERWLALGTFLFVINGVGNAFEASIFSTLGGSVGAAVSFFPSSLLTALAVALLIPAPSSSSLGDRIIEFFSAWRPAALAARLGLAVLAFPVIYFAFGMMVAPIVTPHYASLEFLTIPPLATILQTVFLRSALLCLVSLPILAGWCGSRRQLILGLGLGHFAAVGLGGLIQASFFPAILRWVHGVEILADSMVYAWVLVVLLAPARRGAESSESGYEAHAAPSPAGE